MKLPSARSEDSEGAKSGRWGAVSLDNLNPRFDPAARTQAGTAAGLYARALGDLARRADESIALSIKLPFCAAQCWCCEREVQVAQPRAVIDDYLLGLIDEIERVGERAGGRRDVLQLQLGGGSANELSESQLARLADTLQRAWHLPGDAEMSAECDPRLAGYVQLGVLRGLGFRHLRFGVLDLDEDVQRAIGRRHSVALIDDVCGLARESRIECIELELMLGLPHQDLERWRLTLQHVLAMAPDRVTLSRFRHRPGLAPAQRVIDPAALPDAAECAAMAALSAKLLCDAGYCWVGADLFVLESDPLWRASDQGRLRRSLIGYTAHASTALLGLGARAVGEIDGHLFWNEASVPAWRQRLRQGALPVAQVQPGSDEHAQRRRAIEALMCDLELPQSSASGALAPGYERLARHEGSGWVQRLGDRVVVTQAGRHELPALCAALAGPFATPHEQEPPWRC